MKFFAVCFICAMLCGVVVFEPAVSAEVRTNCDMHNGACRQPLGDRTIELEITPRPVTAMQELVFNLTVTGPPLEKPPYIDLGMPGMKMGPNRVVLEKTAKTTYTGKGVIVRCPSGKRVWEATVTVPGSGKSSFIFDVVY